MDLTLTQRDQNAMHRLLLATPDPGAGLLPRSAVGLLPRSAVDALAPGGPAGHDARVASIGPPTQEHAFVAAAAPSHLPTGRIAATPGGEDAVITNV